MSFGAQILQAVTERMTGFEERLSAIPHAARPQERDREGAKTKLFADGPECACD
jgi:hypothetical protein